MGWENRDYSRESGYGYGYGDGGLQQRLIRLLQWSFPIGTILGIRVRVHWTLIAITFAHLSDSMDVAYTARWLLILFLSVLLHEFGHCLACRRVGGVANEILMWPLGGLAFVAPPRRPWPEFVTVVWGPLVNVILAAASYAALLALTGEALPVRFNPFQLWVSNPTWSFAGLLETVFVVNVGLLVFNLLLVFYPFDGGRLVQIALWARYGLYKSLNFAAHFGIAGAAAVALFGIASGETHLLLIAVFGAWTCYQQLQALRMGALDADEGYDVGYYNTRRHERPGRKGLRGRLQAWRERREAQRRRAEAARQEALEVEVDRVLEKVKQRGMHSLSAAEKRVLQRATAELRTGRR